MQTQVYATGGNPKTPVIEARAAPSDPNPQIRQLAQGGICAFDVNLEALEYELGTDLSDETVDALRTATFNALNETAATSNAFDLADNNPDNDDDIVVLGNPEDC